MRSLLKWIGIIVGGLLGLIVVAALALFVVGNMRATRAPNVAGEALPMPAGAAERGEYLVLSVSACEGCHGPGFSGTEFINEAPIGSLPAPNLTSGRGGVAGQYTSDALWERALRHGIGADGRPLIIMPSQQYTHYADEDAAAIIAYIKSLPPVDSDLPARALNPVANIMLAAGLFGQLPAESVDHDSPHAVSPPRGPTAEYGAYLVPVAVCQDCHGAKLDGVATGGGDPDADPAPNLTPSGNLGSWSQADFIQTLRTGVRPNGVPLSPDMPWQVYGRMTDDDLAAIFAYLQTLPPAAVP